MSVRRLRTFSVALAGLVVAGVLQVVAVPAAHALDAPTNPSPSGLQTGIPTFSWDRVPGATTYEFQISTSDTFGATLVNTTTVQRQYVPKIELPTNVTLYWRVRATGGGETWTVSSFSRTAVGPPNVMGPAAGAELTQPDEPVVLTWEPVPSAVGYEVQYGTDPNFVDQTTTKATETSSYVMPLQAVGPYNWRVRGILGNGVYTGYSASRTYIVKGLANNADVPPTFPPDDENYQITDVVLDWEPIKGAKSYQLQISTDQEFPVNTIVDSQTTVYSTRYSPAKTLGNDQYYWRVRATDAGGFQPSWESRPIWHFQRSWADQTTLGDGSAGPGYPVTVDDAFLTVGDPFYYQWGPIEHASHYELQLSQSPSFNNFTSCFTVHTTLVYGDGDDCWPAAAGSYYWRVVGHDEYSTASPQTDAILAPVGQFTYSPGLVTITGPPSGSSFKDPLDPDPTGKQPVLQWNAKAGAEKYQVTITGPSSKTVTTAALNYAPRDLAPGNYRWDVRTIDHEGAIGAGRVLSSQRSFSVSELPTMLNEQGQEVPVPVPDPLPPAGPPTPSPANLGDSYRFPALRWTPVSYTDYYKVYVRRQGTTGWQALPDQFHYAAGDDIRSTYLDPGTYEWYVEAVRLDDNITASSVGTFTIMQLPDVAPLSYRAALSGNAMTGEAGTLIDTCNATLPATCQNLRQTPVLRWDSPEPNVGYYKLVLSRDAALTNQIETKGIANTMYLDRDALADSQAGSAYFWLVLPCTADGKCSPLTHATHSFNKLSRPLTLTSPDDEAVVENDVTLSWDDYLDSQKLPNDQGTPLALPGQIEAEYYRVQTATDASFTQNVITTSVDQKTFTLWNDTYPEGTVYWRVQAVDETGNLLAWSAARSFIKQSPVPVLVSPADNQTVPGDFTLSWEAQPFAATYDVEVYRLGDTSGNTVNRMVNQNTDRIRYVLENLDPGAGPYTWRVRRKDAKNRPGAWSGYRTFNVTTPGIQGMLPADNGSAEPSDALFTWDPVPGASYYKFERRPGTSGSATESVTTPTTRWAPIASIAGGSHQWRVTAYDAANHVIADSTWSHPFTVVDTPVATVPVSISGAGSVDSTLTLNPAAWNMDLDNLTITYQWYRGSSAITGEVGLTYDVVPADVTKAITVRATATRPGYKTGTSTSNAITGTQAGAPVASVPVTISGTGLHGSTLTLEPPTWETPGVVTTYQWYRGTGAISGQTGTTYTIVTADVGKEISVKATGTKPGYVTASHTSNAVTGALNPAPTPTPPASIAGTGEFGSVLTLTPPDWSPGDVVTAIAWYRDTTKISGQTGQTYTIVQADLGKSITARVTATKPGYVDGTSTSNAIVAKAAAALTPTSSPVISGTAAARETLTASPGTWPSGATFTYQWFVNGLAVARETRSSYVVRTRDAGLPVKVRVTANKVGYLPGEAYSNQMTVRKLVTTTTATLAESTIPKRGRGVLNVHVEVLDLGVSLGKIQILDGTKVIGTAQLKNDTGGDMKIRLKKLLPGKHKLKVVYLGSASTASSKSKRVKLVVLKK